MWRGILILLAGILNNGVMIKCLNGKRLWTKIINCLQTLFQYIMTFILNTSEIHALRIIWQ